MRRSGMGVAIARPSLSVWQRHVTRTPPESGGLAQEVGRLSVLSAPNTPNVRHDWRVLHFPASEDHGWHGLTRIRNADPHMGEFGVCQYAGERRGQETPTPWLGMAREVSCMG